MHGRTVRFQDPIASEQPNQSHTVERLTNELRICYNTVDEGRELLRDLYDKLKHHRYALDGEEQGNKHDRYLLSQHVYKLKLILQKIAAKREDYIQQLTSAQNIIWDDRKQMEKFLRSSRKVERRFQERVNFLDRFSQQPEALVSELQENSKLLSELLANLQDQLVAEERYIRNQVDDDVVGADRSGRYSHGRRGLMLEDGLDAELETPIPGVTQPINTAASSFYDTDVSDKHQSGQRIRSSVTRDSSTDRNRLENNEFSTSNDFDSAYRRCRSRHESYKQRSRRSEARGRESDVNTFGTVRDDTQSTFDEDGCDTSSLSHRLRQLVKQSENVQKLITNVGSKSTNTVVNDVGIKHGTAEEWNDGKVVSVTGIQPRGSPERGKATRRYHASPERSKASLHRRFEGSPERGRHSQYEASSERGNIGCKRYEGGETSIEGYSPSEVREQILENLKELEMTESRYREDAVRHHAPVMQDVVAQYDKKGHEQIRKELILCLDKIFAMEKSYGTAEAEIKRLKLELERAGRERDLTERKLEEEVADLKARLRVKSQFVDSLTGELSCARLELEELRSTRSIMKTSEPQQKEKSENIVDDFAGLKKESQKLKERVEMKSNEVDQLKKDLEKAIEEIEGLRSHKCEETSKEANIQRFESQIISLTEENEKLRLNNQESIAEELAALQLAIVDAEEKQRRLSLGNDKLKRENEEWKKVLRSYSNEFSRKEVGRDEGMEKKESAGYLRSKIDELQSLIAAKDEEIGYLIDNRGSKMDGSEMKKFNHRQEMFQLELQKKEEECKELKMKLKSYEELLVNEGEEMARRLDEMYDNFLKSIEESNKEKEEVEGKVQLQKEEYESLLEEYAVKLNELENKRGFENTQEAIDVRERKIFEAIVNSGRTEEEIAEFLTNDYVDATPTKEVEFHANKVRIHAKEVENENEELYKKLLQLDNEVVRRHKEVEKLRKANKELSEEVEFLKSQKYIKDKVNEDVNNKKIEKYENRLKAKEKECDELKDKLDKYRKEFGEKDELKKRLDEIYDQFMMVDIEKDNLMSSERDDQILEDELEKRDREIGVLKRSNQRLKDLLMHESKVSATNLGYIDDDDVADGKEVSKKRKNRRYSEDLDKSLENELDNKSREVEVLKRSNQRLKDIILNESIPGARAIKVNDDDALEKRCNDLEEENAKLLKRIKDLNEKLLEHSRIDDDYELQGKRLKETEKEYQRLEDDNVSLRERLRTLQKEIKELSSVARSRKLSKSSGDELEKENEKLQEQILLMDLDNERLADDVSELKSRLHKSEYEANDSQEQLKLAKKSAEKMRRVQQENLEMEEKLKEMKRKLDAVEKERKDLNEEYVKQKIKNEEDAKMFSNEIKKLKAEVVGLLGNKKHTPDDVLDTSHDSLPADEKDGGIPKFDRNKLIKKLQTENHQLAARIMSLEDETTATTKIIADMERGHGHLTGVLRSHLILQKGTTAKLLDNSLKQYSEEFEKEKKKFKGIEDKYDKELKYSTRRNYAWDLFTNSMATITNINAILEEGLIKVDDDLERDFSSDEDFEAKDYKSRLWILRRRLGDVEKRYRELMLRSEELSIRLDAKTTEYDVTQAELEDTIKTLEMREALLEEIKREMKSCLDENGRLKRVLGQFKENQEKTVGAVIAENDILRKDLGLHALEDRAKWEEWNGQLKKKLMEAEKSRRSEIDEFREKLRNSEKKRETEVIGMKKMLDQEKTNIENLVKQEEEIERLKKNITEAEKNRKNDIKELKEKLQNSEENRDAEVKEMKKSFDDESRIKEEEINKQKTKFADAQKDISKYQRRISELEDLLKKLEASNAMLEKYLQKARASCRSDGIDHHGTIHMLRDDIKKLFKENEELKQELDSRQKKITSLAADLRKAKVAVKEQTGTNRTLDEQLLDRATRDQMMALKRRIKVLEIEKEKLLKGIDIRDSGQKHGKDEESGSRSASLKKPRPKKKDVSKSADDISSDDKKDSSDRNDSVATGDDTIEDIDLSFSEDVSSSITQDIELRDKLIQELELRLRELKLELSTKQDKENEEGSKAKDFDIESVRQENEQLKAQLLNQEKLHEDMSSKSVRTDSAPGYDWLVKDAEIAIRERALRLLAKENFDLKKKLGKNLKPEKSATNQKLSMEEEAQLAERIDKLMEELRKSQPLSARNDSERKNISQNELTGATRIPRKTGQKVLADEPELQPSYSSSLEASIEFPEDSTSTSQSTSDGLSGRTPKFINVDIEISGVDGATGSGSLPRGRSPSRIPVSPRAKELAVKAINKGLGRTGENSSSREELIDKVREQEEDIKTLLQSVEYFEKEAASLRGKDEEVDDLKERLKEVDDLKKKLKDADALKKRLKEADDVKERLKASEKEIKSVNLRNSKLRDQLKSTKAHDDKLKELEDKMKKLISENKNLEQQSRKNKSQQNEEVKKIAKEKEASKKRIKELQENVRDLQEKIESLRESLLGKEKILQVLSAHLNINDLPPHASESDLQKIMKEAVEMMAGKDAQLSSFSDLEMINRDLEAKLMNETAENRLKLQEIEKLRNEVADLSGKHEANEDGGLRLREIEQLNSQLTTSLAAHQESEFKRSQEIEELRNELARILQSQEGNTDDGSGSQEVEQLKYELEKALEEHLASETRLDEMGEEMRRLKTELDDVTARNVVLEVTQDAMGHIATRMEDSEARDFDLEVDVIKARNVVLEVMHDVMSCVCSGLENKGVDEELKELEDEVEGLKARNIVLEVVQEVVGQLNSKNEALDINKQKLAHSHYDQGSLVHEAWDKMKNILKKFDLFDESERVSSDLHEDFVDPLIKEIRIARNQVEKKSMENKLDLERLAFLESELRDQKALNSDLEKKIDDFKNIIQETNERVKDMENDKDIEDGIGQKFVQDQISDLKDKIGKKDAETVFLEELVDRQERNTERLAEQVRSLEKQLSDRQLEVSQLTQRALESEEDLTLAKNRIEELEDDYQRLLQYGMQTDMRDEKDVEDVENEELLKKMEETINRLEKDKALLEKKVEDASFVNSVQGRDQDVSNSSLDFDGQLERSEEFEILQDTVYRLKVQKAELEKRVGELESERGLKNDKEELRAKEDKISEMEDALYRLELDKEDLERRVEELTTAHDSNIDSRKFLQPNNEMMAEKDEMIAKMEGEVYRLQLDKTDLEKRLHELSPIDDVAFDSSTDKRGDRSSTLEEGKDDIIARMEEDMYRLNLDKNDLEQRVADLISEEKSEIKELKMKYQTTEEKVFDLEQQLHVLSAEYNNLQASMDDLLTSPRSTSGDEEIFDDDENKEIFQGGPKSWKRRLVAAYRELREKSIEVASLRMILAAKNIELDESREKEAGEHGHGAGDGDDGERFSSVSQSGDNVYLLKKEIQIKNKEILELKEELSSLQNRMQLKKDDDDDDGNVVYKVNGKDGNQVENEELRKEVENLKRALRANEESYEALCNQLFGADPAPNTEAVEKLEEEIRILRQELDSKVIQCSELESSNDLLYEELIKVKANTEPASSFGQFDNKATDSEARLVDFGSEAGDSEKRLEEVAKYYEEKHEGLVREFEELEEKYKDELNYASTHIGELMMKVEELEAQQERKQTEDSKLLKGADEHGWSSEKDKILEGRLQRTEEELQRKNNLIANLKETVSSFYENAEDISDTLSKELKRLANENKNLQEQLDIQKQKYELEIDSMRTSMSSVKGEHVKSLKDDFERFCNDKVQLQIKLSEIEQKSLKQGEQIEEMMARNKDLVKKMKTNEDDLLFEEGINLSDVPL